MRYIWPACLLVGLFCYQVPAQQPKLDFNRDVRPICRTNALHAMGKMPSNGKPIYDWMSRLMSTLK